MILNPIYSVCVSAVGKMYTQISIILLLFGLQSFTTHSLSRVELKNGTEVYEVKELANDTVRFINPKAKKPTLREILYYRVVEKPYVEEKKVTEPGDVSLDFDDSVRPFTNSHGFQFVDWGQLENEHQIVDENNKTENEPDAYDEYNDDVKGDDGNDDSDNQQYDEEWNDNSKSKNPLKDDDVSDDPNSSKDNDTNEKQTSHENDQQRNKSEINNKAKKLRSRLFDSMRIKYRSSRRKHIDSSNPRLRKREINYNDIPAPPTLPDLDIHSFPSYIQEMLSNIPSIGHFVSPSSRGNVRNNQKTYGMNIRNGEGYSWNHIPRVEPNRYTQHVTGHSNPTINKPYHTKDIYDLKEMEEPILESHLNIKTNDDYAPKVEPAVNVDVEQGINDMPRLPLQNNHYNRIDLTSTIKPDILYTSTPQTLSELEKFTNILPDLKSGYPNKFYENSEISDDPVTIDLKSKMEKSFDKMIERFPAFEPITSNHKSTIFNNLRNEENHEAKTYGMNLTGNHGYVWNDLPNSKTNYSVGELEEDITQESNKVPTTTANSRIYDNFGTPKTLITPKLIPVITEVTVNEKNVETTPAALVELKVTDWRTTEKIYGTTESFTTKPNFNDNSNKIELSKTIKKENEKKSVKDALDNILKTDAFWDWLTNWTTTYMEVLNEHVSNLIKDEITRQLGKLTNSTEKLDAGDENNIHKNINPDSSNEEEINKVEAEDSKNVTEKNTININDTNDNTDSKIMEEKTVTDPDDKGKILNRENNTSPNNIQAQTIYGSSVGNDRVTNLFIFLQNTDTNKTIAALSSVLHEASPIIQNKPVTQSPNKQFPEKTKNAELSLKPDINVSEDKKSNINKNKTTATVPDKNTTTTKKNIDLDTTGEEISTEDGDIETGAGINGSATETVADESDTDKLNGSASIENTADTFTNDTNIKETNKTKISDDTSVDPIKKPTLSKKEKNAVCLNGSNLEMCGNEENSEESETTETTVKKSKGKKSQTATTDSDKSDDSIDDATEAPGDEAEVEES